MGIRFYCPNGHKLNVKEFQAGRKGICPFCGSKIMIPTHSTRGASKRKKGKREAAPTAEAADESVPAPATASEEAPAPVSPAPASAAISPAQGPAGVPAENGVVAADRLRPSPPDSGESPLSMSGSPPMVRQAGTPPQANDLSGPSPTVPLPGAPTPIQAPRASVSTPVQAGSAAAQGTMAAVAPAAGTAPADPASSFMPHGAVPGSPASNVAAQVTSSPVPPGPVPPAPPSAVPDPIAEGPELIWYVRPPSGGQFGPAAGDLMRTWLAEGRVSADSLVWREGWRDWLAAGDVFPQLRMDSTTAVLGAMGAETVSTSLTVTHRPRHRRKSLDPQVTAALLLLIAVVVLAAVFLWVLLKS